MRCLPGDRISGSINPKSIRRTDDPGGYYGASHAKAACGRYWPDTSPNVLVISVEVAGTAKEGPTEAQQRSMAALWDELKHGYPKAGPLGHRDWQDVKPCPGRTTAMKAAFSAMGGHGTDHSEVQHVSTRDHTSGQVCTVRDGSKLHDYPCGLPIGTVDPPLAAAPRSRARVCADFAVIDLADSPKKATLHTQTGWWPAPWESPGPRLRRSDPGGGRIHRAASN